MLNCFFLFVYCTLLHYVKLPFSDHSDTRDCVLKRGMGISGIPLHLVTLNHDLVQGEVAVVFRPALPIEGVHMILGNRLAGKHV